MTQTASQVKKTIYFSKEFAKYISKLAEHEHRSFSAQVIMMLKHETVGAARWVGGGMEEIKEILKDE